jgi:DNA-binding response OmpR family regulator
VKVLLAEDDPDLLDVTAYSLRREGFRVIEATDGAQAIQRWVAESPDIVVLDLGLPRQDGFEVLRRIRTNSPTPVVVLTGRTDEQGFMRCFSLGTDDYVTKPFSAKQLAMRIRAILRRSVSAGSADAPQPLAIGDLRLDPEFHEVLRAGQIVNLTPIEFRILYLLALNLGRVVTLSRIFAYVWGQHGGDANALRSHISHIRRKLQLPHGAISSLPAVGYQLDVELDRDVEASVSGRFSSASRVTDDERRLTRSRNASPGEQ